MNETRESSGDPRKLGDFHKIPRLGGGMEECRQKAWRTGRPRKTECFLEVLLTLLSWNELNLDFSSSFPKARDKPEVPIPSYFQGVGVITLT